MIKDFILFLLISIAISTPLYGITLDEAIDIALKNNPDFLIQKHKLMEAKDEKKSKKSINYGKIKAVGSYTSYNLPRTLSPIVPPVTPDIVTSREIGSIGMSYEVPIFSGFGDIASVKIASLGEKISKIKLNLTKQELIFNIKSLYFKILSLKNQQKTSEDYYNALKELYSSVKKGVALGKKAEVDLLKISADLEDVSFNLKSIKNSIESLKATLAALIGVDKIKDVSFVSYDEKECKIIDIKNTYKYKLAQIEVKKYKNLLKKAKSLYYPKIGFKAFYGDNYAKGEKQELWQAQVTLSWLLFDFGGRSSEVQKAKHSYMNALLKLKKTRLELQSIITDAQNKISTALAKVNSTKKQLAFLSKVKEIERVKYREGVSNIYDVLFAYAKYQEAKSNYVNSLYNLRIEKAFLNYLLAGER